MNFEIQSPKWALGVGGRSSRAKTAWICTSLIKKYLFNMELPLPMWAYKFTAAEQWDYMQRKILWTAVAIKHMKCEKLPRKEASASTSILHSASKWPEKESTSTPASTLNHVAHGHSSHLLMWAALFAFMRCWHHSLKVAQPKLRHCCTKSAVITPHTSTSNSSALRGPQLPWQWL